MLNHAIQTDVRQRKMETSVQKRVMNALASMADENGEVNRSLAEIALKAQACTKTVVNALHKLANQGEILILNRQRVKGHYRINKLPDTEKPRIDSLRTPIVEAIRLLPLPVRVSVIFQALGKYASRSGNNIFPSVKTIVRDTGYSKLTIQETIRWLLRVGLIAPDKDCINPKYQSRSGYKIPGWNANAQLLTISEELIGQIKTLHRRRHKRYWEKLEEVEATEAGQDDSTWLEDHSFDLAGYQHNDEQWFEDESESEAQGEEERTPSMEDAAPAAKEHDPVPQDIQSEEPAPAAAEDYLPEPQDIQGEREEGPTPLPFIRPGTHSEMFRIALRPQRKPVPITLKQYHDAMKAIQPHLDIVERHDNGLAPVDEGTLKKSLAILSFYERTITLYEQQVQRE
jgi:hypothetical protein